MRDVEPEIRALGGELVVVGNGSVAQAAQFHKEMKLHFRLLTDPGLKSYEAAGFRRGVSTTLSVQVLTKGIQAFREGFRQTSTQGDPFQQGGAFVVASGGELKYQFVSQKAGEHPEPSQLLAAIQVR